VNTVNRPIALATAHKLRSAAAAILADAARQADARLADSLTYEAGEIQARADSIEEQLKPVIEEPTEFGSIVRAGSPQDAPATEFDLWTPTPRRKHYWMSQSGLCEVWSELTDVEVLRVGIGDALPTTAAELGRMSVAAHIQKRAEEHACAKGAERAKTVHLMRLRDLRAGAISAERKDAYDKAICAVEEPLP
jgi:hypothetical protein